MLTAVHLLGLKVRGQTDFGGELPLPTWYTYDTTNTQAATQQTHSQESIVMTQSATRKQREQVVYLAVAAEHNDRILQHAKVHRQIGFRELVEGRE